MKKVSYNNWKEELKKSDIRKNSLRILASLFDKDEKDEQSVARRYSDLQPRYDMTNTQTFLKNSTIKCPPVNRALLNGYLNYFEKQGYI